MLRDNLGFGPWFILSHPFRKSKPNLEGPSKLWRLLWIAEADRPTVGMMPGVSSQPLCLNTMATRAEVWPPGRPFLFFRTQRTLQFFKVETRRLGGKQNWFLLFFVCLFSFAGRRKADPIRMAATGL